MKAVTLTIRILTGLLGIAAGTVAFADPVSLAMHQAESGNFYVHATVDGNVETDLLFDTGSGYVSLSKATFDKVSATAKPRFSRHIFGRMADGRVEKVAMYFLDELKLADNCVLREIEVAVFPKADRDILGLNALSRLQPFTMALTPATLTSNNCAA